MPLNVKWKQNFCSCQLPPAQRVLYADFIYEHYFLFHHADCRKKISPRKRNRHQTSTDNTQNTKFGLQVLISISHPASCSIKLKPSCHPVSGQFACTRPTSAAGPQQGVLARHHAACFFGSFPALTPDSLLNVWEQLHENKQTASLVIQ